jgi:integrase
MAKPTFHYGKWRIRPTDAHGKRMPSQVFASKKEAAHELRKIEIEVEEIKRGLRSAQIPDKTFGELCDYWLSRRVPLKRNAGADQSIIRVHLRPAFGHQLIRSIGVAETDAYQAERAHLDKKTVANHLTLLISMLNLAVDLNWLAKCPKIRKPRIPLFTADYRYLRTEEEIQRFLAAAREEGENIFALYATAIYTGMREGELAALHRSSVDLNKRLITIQNSFDGPTKAGDVRYAPVLDPLLPILHDWLSKNRGPLVFPNEAGNMYQKSAWIFQETLHRVLTRAGFPKVRHKGKERWYIRFHDLRHTFASHWVANGGSTYKLRKILGHKSEKMVERYAHLAPEVFASDYGRLGVRAPLEVAEVIPLHQADVQGSSSTAQTRG